MSHQKSIEMIEDLQDQIRNMQNLKIKALECDEK